MSWLMAGFQRFPAERDVLRWVDAVRSPALAAANDPMQRSAWLRHGATWFVGVDALPNDPQGRVGDGPRFDGAALRAAVAATQVSALHPAQISVTYPGYPRRDADETEAAHRFRKQRDAAHLDGLLPEGPDKRRHLREPHAWILGVALSNADPDAAPLVVWEGSQHVMRKAMGRAFNGVNPGAWGDVDVTDIYAAARAEVFETCTRVTVPLKRGESVLVHRMAIHGVAPWAEGAQAAPEGRVVAYFRPCFDDLSAWLSMP